MQSLSSAILSTFRTLSEDEDYAVLLDGSGGPLTPLSQTALMGIGCEALWQLEIQEDVPYWYERISQQRIAFETTSWQNHLRKQIGGEKAPVFLWAQYEAAAWLDPAQGLPMGKAVETSLDAGLLGCLICHTVCTIDLKSGELTVLKGNSAHLTTQWTMSKETIRNNPPALRIPTSESYSDWKLSLPQEEYEAAVQKIKMSIQQGEVYQANLATRFQQTLPMDPWTVYAELTQRNPSPFSALLKTPKGYLLSNSPERLVNLNTAGTVNTRPIAGTRGRGTTQEEDEALGQALQLNEKERAEHLMLVDLQRNDIGRVCLPGSVDVDELMVLERYSHVTHLVSNVQGQLSPQKDALDLLKATFPGGTITGCPKRRCMELLNKLEPVPRGFYTGSLGWWNPTTGAADFNILIRTATLTHKTDSTYQITLHAGAGIVHDSNPAYEFKESLRKAEALRQILTESAIRTT